MTLTVTDLSIQRGGLPLLEGVRFVVAPGEALILRGPNGVGKTTLLRTLAGLQPATSGTIDAPAEGMAYAAHTDGVKAVLTVDENLSFWSGIYGSNLMNRAKSAMDLDALGERRGGTLSAGQRRRVGLARLILAGRGLWLLDEPTVSLDTGSVSRLMAVLEAHRAAGGMAVIATHPDLALSGARSLDLGRFKARPSAAFGGAEGFE